MADSVNPNNRLIFLQPQLLLLAVFLIACNPPSEKSKHKKHLQRTGMVYIPAGEFIMGTVVDDEESHSGSYGFDRIPYANEVPRHRRDLEAFYIDRYEVTFGEYKSFLDKTGYPKPEIWGEIDFSKRSRYPAFGIRYADAAAYAKWVGKRLPTEAEWARAARGTQARRFPWGNEINKFQLDQLKWLHEVGDIPFDRTSDGIYDLAGNVSEWTSDWYLPYSGNEDSDPDYGEKHKVCRGFHHISEGGHYYIKYFYRNAYRGVGNIEEYHTKIGFRCAVSADAP